MTPEQIAELTAKMKGINDGVTGLNERFNGTDKLITGYEQRIKTIEEAFKNRVSIPGVENGDGKVKFSFRKAMYAILTGDWKDAGFEQSVFNETKQRAMATSTGVAGGYIVPVEIVNEIIPLLRAKQIVRQLGATVLDNLVGSPVPIPKQTGGATVYDVGENQAITASNMAFGELNLTPKSMGALVVGSRRLAVLANPSYEGMVRNDLATAIALGLDYRALRGRGYDAQALGVVNTPGIGSLPLGTDGVIPTIDNLWDLVNLVEMADADVGALGFAMSPKILNVFRKVKDSYGAYVLQPDPSMPGKKTLCGYNVLTTTQLPINLVKGNGTNCSEILFGNWADLVIALWGGLVLEASTETSTAFAAHQVWIKAIMDYDIGLRHPASLALIPDAKVAA